ALNRSPWLTCGLLKVVSQHGTPSLRPSWTFTGATSGSAGMGRFVPLPARLILALPAAPGLSEILLRPSGVSSLSTYLNPPPDAFQHGLPAHVPPAGATVVATRLPPE